MKIIIIGANGKEAGYIINEALKKSLDVTGLVRGEGRNSSISYIKKDALDLTLEDLKNFDVIVDAVGGWDEATIPNISKVMKHLANILDGTNKKLYVVGGAGSLYVNKERTITVDMGPEFPNAWKPLSNAHRDGLNCLRESNSLNWVYVSPACNFVADGKRTGEYQIAGEELVLNNSGQSEISYADYAIALIDIIISNKYNKERISVCSK